MIGRRRTGLGHRTVAVRAAGYSLRLRPRALAAGAAIAAVVLLATVVAIGSGEFPMSPVEVLRTLAGHGAPSEAFIVEQVRLPRAVTAVLAGGALGLAGAVFQSVVRNPLGSPDVLGFTGGAAAGALATIVLAGGGSLALPIGAVAGGVTTGVVIYALAWRRGVTGYRLVLVGIGVAAVLTGLNGYLLSRARIVDAQRAVLWLTGSLDGRGWGEALPLLGAMLLVAPLLLYGGRDVAMMEMGDELACALGIPVQRRRLLVLAGAVVLTSCAAAATGPVAFVALTGPQLARRLTGAPGPNLLASLGTGSALLVTADLAAQRVVPGHQLPAGVVTGVLGGGYLVWLLTTERKAGRL